MGDPSGVSLGWRPTEWNAFQAGAGWDRRDGQCKANSDNLSEVDPRGGASLRARAPIGASLRLMNQPIELFAHVIPTFRVVPDLRFGVDGALGLRYYFRGSRGPRLARAGFVSRISSPTRKGDMRRWIPSVLVFVAAMVGGHLAARLLGPEPAAASAQASESAPSAAEVRRWLLGGNALFASGEAIPTDIDPIRRASISAGQTPWCTVLTCSDSRVPPEHIFDAGLGRIFTVRVAGNVADPVTIGSVEYAVEHLHTPLVMVLGHERCGAVTAALSPKSLGPNLDTLLGYIRPGIAGITDLEGAIQANVDAQIATLRKSAVLAELESEGKVTFLGAVYDLDSGLVSPLDSSGHAAAAPHGHDHDGAADAGHGAPSH